MRMLIAGGGTGGHLFPGIAVAEEFLARDPVNKVMFVGTEQGIEKKILPGTGYPYKMIRSEPLVGQSFLSRLRGLLVLPLSGLDALAVLRSFQPQLVLGTGGYVSGPVTMVAHNRGIPTAIHEQNSRPGATNRILGKRVDLVFLTFEAARSEFPEADKEKRIIVSGNPIRRAIREALARQEHTDRAPGKSLRLLVVGGSQGAHRLNLLVLNAMSLLGEAKDKIKVTHQTGEADWYETAAAYAHYGIRAKVLPFIEDMASALKEADLIISRAGAGAIAEITLAGKPSILVPFPFAAGDHQTINAQALLKAGASVVIKDDLANGPMLAETVRELLHHPEKRQAMGAQARAIARPDAARVIVDHCLKLAKEKSGKK